MFRGPLKEKTKSRDNLAKHAVRNPCRGSSRNATDFSRSTHFILNLNIDQMMTLLASSYLFNKEVVLIVLLCYKGAYCLQSVSDALVLNVYCLHSRIYNNFYVHLSCTTAIWCL